MPSKTSSSRKAPSLSRLMQLVEDIDYAMLTTVGSNGLLVSRPLSTRQSTVDDLTLRFFTDRSSAKVDEIARDNRVNLAYASSSKNVFVSFAGRARVHRDPAMIEALWSDAMKAFFPKGKSDPDLVVLEVVGETAEVWEGPSSLIGKAIAFVTARITGNPDALGTSSQMNLQAGRKSSPKPSARATAKAPASTKRAAAEPRVAAAAKAIKDAPVRPRVSAGVAGLTSKRARPAAGATAKPSAKEDKAGSVRPAAGVKVKQGAKPVGRN